MYAEMSSVLFYNSWFNVFIKNLGTLENLLTSTYHHIEIITFYCPLNEVPQAGII